MNRFDSKLRTSTVDFFRILGIVKDNCQEKHIKRSLAALTNRIQGIHPVNLKKHILYSIV